MQKGVVTILDEFGFKRPTQSQILADLQQKLVDEAQK